MHTSWGLDLKDIDMVMCDYTGGGSMAILTAHITSVINSLPVFLPTNPAIHIDWCINCEAK